MFDTEDPRTTFRRSAGQNHSILGRFPQADKGSQVATEPEALSELDGSRGPPIDSDPPLTSLTERRDSFEYEVNEKYDYQSSGTQSVVSLSTLSLEEEEEALVKSDYVSDEEPPEDGLVACQAEAIAIDVSATSAKKAFRKSVQFDRVHVHFHETILGDNPACTHGPPIGIGWRRVDSLTMGLREFERSNRVPFKKQTQLKISPAKRLQILRANGYKKDRILERMHEIQALHAENEVPQRSTSYPAPKIVTLLSRVLRRRDKNL